MAGGSVAGTPRTQRRKHGCRHRLARPRPVVPYALGHRGGLPARRHCAPLAAAHGIPGSGVTWACRFRGGLPPLRVLARRVFRNPRRSACSGRLPGRCVVAGSLWSREPPGVCLVHHVMIAARAGQTRQPPGPVMVNNRVVEASLVACELSQGAPLVHWSLQSSLLVERGFRGATDPVPPFRRCPYS
jgi:hypothetical protein